LADYIELSRLSYGAYDLSVFVLGFIVFLVLSILFVWLYVFITKHFKTKNILETYLLICIIFSAIFFCCGTIVNGYYIVNYKSYEAKQRQKIEPILIKANVSNFDNLKKNIDYLEEDYDSLASESKVFKYENVPTSDEYVNIILNKFYRDYVEGDFKYEDRYIDILGNLKN
jgi:predicted PurR-regulated permease PerM